MAVVTGSMKIEGKTENSTGAQFYDCFFESNFILFYLEGVRAKKKFNKKTHRTHITMKTEYGVSVYFMDKSDY